MNLIYPPTDPPYHPYHDLPRVERIPVRSNIDPQVDNFIFKQLIPFNGIQGEVIAFLLDRLYQALLDDPRIPKRTSTRGTISTYYDGSAEDSVAIFSSILNQCNFRRSDCSTDRVPGARDDAGPAPDACGDVPDKQNSRPNPPSEPLSVSAEGLRGLAEAIYKE